MMPRKAGWRQRLQLVPLVQQEQQQMQQQRQEEDAWRYETAYWALLSARAVAAAARGVQLTACTSSFEFL